jgi:hypothetical protein
VAAAIEMLEQLAARQPSEVEAWFALGRAHGMLDQDRQAEAAFRRAAQLRPDLRDAHLNVALSLAYQGRPREAMPALLEARRLSPGDREVNDTLLWVVLSALQEEPGHGAPPALAPLGPEPLVSVIIPTRNRPAMLRDALESVARQRYGRWEVLVVNDGGEDVAQVLASLPAALGGRITLLNEPQARGAAAARNRALGAARGEVMAFLDDDDLYLPEHLAALVAQLRASGAPFAYTRSIAVEEKIVDGRRVEMRRGTPREYRVSHAMLLVRNLIPTANWGVRRECFERYGLFDESLACAEDWDLLLRLSSRFPLQLAAQVTAEIRVRPDTADSVTRRVPLRPICELFYRRYPSGGRELVELGRAVYLECVN